jgi:exodeoxyribonuclease V beta subunit
MSALDIYQLPLADTQLIEASAGTGKTWTIAGLYIRLLLQSQRRVNEILVVTFTKAATAELRERLRERIVQVEQALNAGPDHKEHNDVFCQWAVETFTGTQLAVAKQQLEAAHRCFDEAAIFTIHGFCQRMLTEAQMPALLVEPDIVPDERDILPALVQEAWIRHCHDNLLADLLKTGGATLDIVLDDIRALLRKPYLDLRSGDLGTTLSATLEALKENREVLCQEWKKNGDAIREDIRGADGLKKAEKDYKYLDDMLVGLDAWLSGGVLTQDLELFTPSEFDARKKQKGRLPLHGFWAQLEQWFTHADIILQQFRLAMIADVRAALQLQKEQQGLLSYQDLLSQLSEAVNDPAIAAEIRLRYPAALIDEFQDTDPLQFQVFNQVYKDSGLPLFLVGDPKQAIYSFRGADIFTYLRARESAVLRHTLDINRRSLPVLVKAVNTVFSQNTNPFIFSDLRFQNVEGVTPALLPVFSDAKMPLHCSLLPEAEGKPLSKEKAETLSAETAAEEIVALLQQAAAGKTLIPDEQHAGKLRPLAPADIAVLVPTHRHGHMMTDALIARGVSVVQRSEESVFATQEAVELHHVLEAVIAPGREGLVKAALMGTLLGYSVETLYAAQHDDARWSHIIETLLTLRERWQKQGFMAMWEALLNQFSVFNRLLALSQGERRLTNLRHLATLMQHQADKEPAAERQLNWLREQLAAGEKNEETQLRLESDAERVQILTVHVSKGLEYPVVFCPFLWTGRSQRKEIRAEYRSGDKSLLDIGSDKFEHAQERMGTERLAEQMRVLYVALTRAKYRCHIIWGNVRDSELAPLSWLLLGQNVIAEPAIIRATLKNMAQADYTKALDAVQKNTRDGFSWNPLVEASEKNTLVMAAKNISAPVTPAFHRTLTRSWRVSSFTGLSASAHSAHHTVIEQETPDHDAQQIIIPAQNDSAFAEKPLTGIHAFPRGAQAGVFWHELLENLLMGAVRDRRIFVADTLKKFAIDPVWLPLVETVLTQWLDTPLKSHGSGAMVLSQLEGRVAEMEFIYPVHSLHPADFLTLPDVPPLYMEALKNLDFTTLKGYLKGFMDLVCRHNGQYYVVDYKTNWLGPEADAYTAERLQRCVAESHYYLQYWLYTLALHRHLRASLQEKYDYDRDMGGVRYLFLRGIDAATQGVYAAKPSRALIEALDHLMEARL